MSTHQFCALWNPWSGSELVSVSVKIVCTRSRTAKEKPFSERGFGVYFFYTKLSYRGQYHVKLLVIALISVALFNTSIIWTYVCRDGAVLITRRRKFEPRRVDTVGSVLFRLEIPPPAFVHSHNGKVNRRCMEMVSVLVLIHERLHDVKMQWWVYTGRWKKQFENRQHIWCR